MRQWHFGCNLHSWRDFVNTIRWLAVGALVAVITLWALFSLSLPRVDTGEARVAAEFADPSHSSAISGADGDRLPEADPDATMDLFGNDVTDAVAQYRLDATGSLYEVHSPQTEIPKLASPKS
jgi:hypothetical protein